MKKNLTCVLVLLFGISVAQDPTFTNNNQSLILLNPSFAGSNGGVRNQLSVKRQWPQFSFNFTTISNSFDCFIKPLCGAIALTVMQDDYASVLKANSINLTYAQHFPLRDGDFKFIPSFQVGYNEKIVDLRALFFGDPLDARQDIRWSQATAPMPISRINYVNLSSGLLFSFKEKFYSGISIFNMNRPDIGFLGASRLASRILFHSSYNIKLSDKNLLQVFARYYKQSKFENLEVSANILLLKHFVAGAYISNNNSGGVLAGFKTEYFNLQLGYEQNLMPTTFRYDGWEIHTSLNLVKNKSDESVRSFESW